MGQQASSKPVCRLIQLTVRQPAIAADQGELVWK
jgi:hypothetical protein